MKSILKNSIVIMGLFVVGVHTASAQWIQTNWPGGIIDALAVSGNNIFVGTYNDVFLSINNGTSWAAVDSGFPATNTVNCFAVSGSNIFAGTTGYGVFLSTNNGANWTAVDSGLTNLSVFSLAVSGSNIFAGTYMGGVFLSTNNGTSWTAVNSGLSIYPAGGIQTVRSLAVSGNNIFAVTYNGAFLTTNNGTSWTAVNSGSPANVNCFAVSGSNIFAGTWGYGVFLSTNNGASWTAVNSGLGDNDVWSLAVSDSNIFVGVNSHAVMPYIPGIYLSTDNGSSWTSFSSNFPANAVGVPPEPINLAVNNTNIFAAYSSRIWYRPLSEIKGIASNKSQKMISKQYAGGFKINTNKNSFVVLLPQFLTKGILNIELFNVDGKKIYSATHQAQDCTLNIPLVKLSTGEYLMSIRGDNASLSSPFVVTK